MKRENIISPLAIIALLLWAGPISAETCATVYEQVVFKPLRELERSGEKNLCVQSSLYRQALKQGFKFVLSEKSEWGPNAPVLVELVTNKRRILHPLRYDVSYGEFIDQELTEDGAHKKATSLILVEAPRSPPNKTALRDLRFVYAKEDYIWGPVRVEEVRRQQRLVSMNYEGELNPLGEWQESTAKRRLVYLSVEDETKEGKSSSTGQLSTVITSYFDPIFDHEQFFRHFALRLPKQLTVLQFVSIKGESSPAFVELLRDGTSVKRIRVADPGDDKLELTIHVKEGKAAPVY